MSWHCSQALVAEFSALNCLDGESCAQLKSTRTAERSYFDDRKKASSKRSRYGTILEPLMVVRGIGKWMSLLEASPASPSRLLDSNGEQTTSGICGPTPFALLEKSDQGGVSWRTCQLCLLQDTLEQFSEIWPRAAMMRDGKCYRQPKLELPISEIGSGLWPSPKALEVDETVEQWEIRRQNPKAKMMGPSLTVAAKQWPSPRYSEHKGCGPHGSKSQEYMRDKNYLCAEVSEVEAKRIFPTPRSRDAGDWVMNKARQGIKPEDTLTGVACDLEGVDKFASNGSKGQLNPDWVCWLMNWPIGWTSLKPFEWGNWPSDDWWSVDPADSESNKQWPSPRAGNPGSRPNMKGGKILAEEAKKTPSQGTIPRVATGIPNRVDRLKALGNGQVPLCVKVAWEILIKEVI